MDRKYSGTVTSFLEVTDLSKMKMVNHFFAIIPTSTWMVSNS